MQIHKVCSADGLADFGIDEMPLAVFIPEVAGSVHPAGSRCVQDRDGISVRVEHDTGRGAEMRLLDRVQVPDQRSRDILIDRQIGLVGRGFGKFRIDNAAIRLDHLNARRTESNGISILEIEHDHLIRQLSDVQAVRILRLACSLRQNRRIQLVAVHINRRIGRECCRVKKHLAIAKCTRFRAGRLMRRQFVRDADGLINHRIDDLLDIRRIHLMDGDPSSVAVDRVAVLVKDLLDTARIRQCGIGRIKICIDIAAVADADVQHALVSFCVLGQNVKNMSFAVQRDKVRNIDLAAVAAVQILVDVAAFGRKVVDREIGLCVDLLFPCIRQ